MNDGLLLTTIFAVACILGGALITWHVSRRLKLRERANDALFAPHGDFPNVPQMRKPPRG